MNVGQNLRVVGRIGDPAHLGSLHGKPKSNPFGVITPSLGVVRQPLGECPLANRLNLNSIQARKGSQAVVGNHRFCSDCRATTHQLIVLGVVIGAMKGTPGVDVYELAVSR